MRWVLTFVAAFLLGALTHWAVIFAVMGMGVWAAVGWKDVPPCS